MFQGREVPPAQRLGLQDDERKRHLMKMGRPLRFAVFAHPVGRKEHVVRHFEERDEQPWIVELGN